MLPCGGYERPTIWVNLTPETGLARGHAYKDPPNVALRDSLARSAYHEQYLGQFWKLYLPAGRAFPARSPVFSAGSWLNDLPRRFRTEESQALKQILLAVALTSVGKRDNEPWLVEKGIAYYGSSLVALSRQLEAEHGHISDSGLATSNLLSLFEVRSFFSFFSPFFYFFIRNRR